MASISAHAFSVGNGPRMTISGLATRSKCPRIWSAAQPSRGERDTNERLLGWIEHGGLWRELERVPVHRMEGQESTLTAEQHASPHEEWTGRVCGHPFDPFP
jgi:hypothetical protein